MHGIDIFNILDNFSIVIMSRIQLQCFLLSWLWVYPGILDGQQNDMGSFPPSQWLLIESHLGRASVEHQGTKVIGGFGLCHYLTLKNFQKRKTSSIGLNVPMRVDITSPNEEVLMNYEYSISAAALFRGTFQQRPNKETLWFFLGAGPEVRIIWGDDESSRGLPLFQQEFGIKVTKANSILLRNTEIGFTTSFPVRKNEWDDLLYFGSLFIRLKAF